MAGSTLFDLTGKVAAVIGGASGIGEAVARGAAQLGARVTILDANEEAARSVASAIGGDAARLDIRRAGEVQDAFAGIAAAHGQLDIVICTPSINVRKPIVRYEEAEFDRVVDVNLKGSFNVLQAAGRLMTTQKARGGSIVIFSSIRSQVVEPGQSVYAMTKAGIVQLVRTAAVEFGAHGVRVNAIGPGVVETPLTAPIKANAAWYAAYANKSALGRWARAEEMVGPTLFLASDAASYVTGTILFADGGWTAIDGRFAPPGM